MKESGENHRKTSRVRLWSRSHSEKHLTNSPRTPSSLPAVEEDSPALAPPSPGTPPKKAWEQQYRSYLSKNQLDGRNLSSYIPPVSRQQLSGKGASITEQTLKANSIAQRDAQKLSAAEDDRTSDNNTKPLERSVRGGNIFSKIFRSQSAGENNTGTITPKAQRRRIKSLSHGATPDELDGTLRRGTEKAYSPGNQRFHPSSARSQDELDRQCMSNKYIDLNNSSFIPPATLQPGLLNRAILKSAPDILYNPACNMPPIPVISSGNATGRDTLDQEVPNSLHPRPAVNQMDDYAVQSALMRQSPDALSTGSIVVSSKPPPPPPPLTGEQQELDLSSSSAMKKAFTEFHNSSETGRDAVSAYLGDEPSGTGHSLAWTQSQRYGATFRSGSFPRTAVSHEDFSRTADGTTISPPQAILHESIPISKGRRILKPVKGVETWQQGRRYLIAPAVLASCPVQVLSMILDRREHMLSAQVAVQRDSCSFEGIVLGRCLLSYTIGGGGGSGSSSLKHTSTVQQWSSATLVLRQNYLLEYDADLRIGGTPRGFAHLQLSNCVLHPHFADALELTFYGSPCAKSDKRTLTIRLMHLDGGERNHWMALLNRASKLTVSDLYEYSRDKPLSTSGSYSGVYPGRRRDSSRDNNDSNNFDEKTPYNRALKIFDKSKFWRHVVNGRERADTLVRETSVQATLTARCKNIHSFCRLTGFFETSENIVLELELLNGRDLFNFISSRNALPESDAAQILRDILMCLDAMNRIGLAHRDIKPANILMCREDDGPSVKVGDFGMSTFVGVDGHLRGRCGTPGYVAPEVFFTGAHGGYGNKVDVFSAGVTLYVMLCGYEPFYGETDAELVEANKSALVEFPQEDWSSVSNAAMDLVRKMMHPDPSLRLSANQALQHPWMSSHVKDSTRQFSVSDPEDEVCIVS